MTRRGFLAMVGAALPVARLLGRERAAMEAAAPLPGWPDERLGVKWIATSFPPPLLSGDLTDGNRAIVEFAGRMGAAHGRRMRQMVERA